MKTAERIKEVKDIFISFSGGKTSAYMAKIAKEKYGKTHKLHFVFMNTGQEHPETYKFIDNCDKEFGLNLVWLEAVVHHKHLVGTGYRIVVSETAHQGLRLFEDLVYKYGLPNASGLMHCTRELKLAPFNKYVSDITKVRPRKSKSYNRPHLTAIGIRADEIDRVSVKMVENNLFYPLADEGITKEDVNAFWESQSFNLNIPHRLGNCMGCHKKSFRKLVDNCQDPKIYSSIKAIENMKTIKKPQQMFRGERTIDDVIRDFSKPDANQEEMKLSSGCSESCEVFN